jgi:hypothetical protein
MAGDASRRLLTPAYRPRPTRLSLKVTYALPVSEAPESSSSPRRFRLAFIGVLVAVLFLLELYTGFVLAWAWYSPFPPAWPGVIISLVAALVGPMTAFFVWRLGRRKGQQKSVTLGRVEAVGAVVGFSALVVLFGMLFITSI